MAQRKVDLEDISSDLQPFTGQGLRGMIGHERVPVVPGDDHNLSPSEADALHRCEIIIERGLKTFFEVGAALMQIRELRLYRTGYDTFEQYCTNRWSMSRPHAYRLIDAAQVQTNLSPIGDILPTNEAQTRPLTRLKDPEQQREAWQRALSTAHGPLTAAHIEAVVRELLGQYAPTAPAEADSAGARIPEALTQESSGTVPGDSLSPPTAETLQTRIAELEHTLATVRSIIEEYQDHITRAQQYKPTSDRGAAVEPLLAAIERVWGVLREQ